MKRLSIHCTFILVVFLSCDKEAAEPKPFKTPESILFVGNSYTFYNSGLAYHIGNFVTHDPSLPVVKVEEVTQGGYSLESHWNDPETINKIKSQQWDVIVLQEQSYRPISDRGKMLLYAHKFDSLIRATDPETKIYFFMTWGYKKYPDMITTLAEAYEQAARETHRSVAPVGLEWDAFLKSADAIELYDTDGQHPNLYGTFFTASIFYKVLFRKDPNLNPYKDPALTDEEGQLLKDWGDKANEIEY